MDGQEAAGRKLAGSQDRRIHLDQRDSLPHLLGFAVSCSHASALTVSGVEDARAGSSTCQSSPVSCISLSLGLSSPAALTNHRQLWGHWGRIPPKLNIPSLASLCLNWQKVCSSPRSLSPPPSGPRQLPPTDPTTQASSTALDAVISLIRTGGRSRHDVGLMHHSILFHHVLSYDVHLRQTPTSP